MNATDKAYGVKGDGRTDDTAALQSAVNAVAGTGGTLLIPAGTYMINAVVSLFLKSDMTLKMAQGAILKAFPTSASNYSILKVANASRINILGGQLLGDYGTPVTHLGENGEWGMGLAITNSAHVTIVGVTASDCWGDGFNLGQGASQILICSVVADHNRRSGLTLTSADSVVVRDSVFRNSGGTLPEPGLNIEPNSGETVSNLLVTGCTFTGNAGGGIQDTVPLEYTGRASVLNVTLDGNTVTGNGRNALNPNLRSGIEVSNCAGHKVMNNVLSSNFGHGILLRDGATGILVQGNTVTGNLGHGLWVTTSGNAVSGNSVSGNALLP